VRIHPPNLERTADGLRLSARVELVAPAADNPDTLWFEYPAEQEAFVSGGSEGFVVSLLLLAMTRREDIQVCGPLSPYLSRALPEYQRVFHIWHPAWFHLISVHSESPEPPVRETPAHGAASMFSGGVDSFYTLHSHLPQNEPIPEFRLTHALFVHGFDIPLEDTASYAEVAREYAAMMRSLGLQLLTLKTNVRQFLHPLSWELAHGPAMIGCALTLSRAFSRLYIPASHSYAVTRPWGSDYRTDPLLSTDRLQVVHDGAGQTRGEKIQTVAHWPEAFGRLRVCWKKPEGLRNCCQCRKCVRTMLALELAGTLSRFTTFPLPLTRKAIRGSRLTMKQNDEIYHWLVRQALATGRRDLVFDLRYAFLTSFLRVQTGRLLRTLSLRK
jgi:hypothetical protein